MLIISIDWHPAKERTALARRRRKRIKEVEEQIRFLRDPGYVRVRTTWKEINPLLDELVDIPVPSINCCSIQTDGSVIFRPRKNNLLKTVLPPELIFSSQRDALIFLTRLKEQIEIGMSD